jgi:arylsulfate sulfotransferase
METTYQSRFNLADGHFKYAVIQDFFSDIRLDSAFINQIDSTDIDKITFYTDNKNHLCIPSFFIHDVNVNFSDFELFIQLSNKIEITVPIFREIKSLILDSIVLDPYLVNPLCAFRSMETLLPLSVQVTVLGKNGPLSDIQHVFSGRFILHKIPILGLYPDYENQVVFQFISKHGSVFYHDTVQISTRPIQVFTSDILILQSQPERMKPGLNLVNARNHPKYEVPFMFDMFGDIRWLLDYGSHPELNRLFYDVGIDRLKNGNWYFGDGWTEKIYEVGILGNVINSWSLGEFTFHHQVVEKENGNFIVTVSKPGSLHINGRVTKEDHVIEIDRKTGAILHELDLKESLDEERVSVENTLNNNRVDWLHANAVYPDPSDQTIILSSRYQGVVKVTTDNQIKWILSPHEGWMTNRYGDDLSSYLLAPLDASGQRILNPAVLAGTENHPDFEWNWGQHASHKIENGHLILYDNGYNRNFGLSDEYSRIVEYEINESELTIKQVWSFGKQFGSSLYSTVGSNVEYDPHYDNFFMNGGFVVPTTNGHGGKMLEIDRTTKEIVFEAELTADDAFAFHRMYRIPLYPD